MNRQNFVNEDYRVAIYMRLSKDDGDKEESESIVNQRKILKSFVKENQYTLYSTLQVYRALIWHLQEHSQLHRGIL